MGSSSASGDDRPGERADRSGSGGGGQPVVRRSRTLHSVGLLAAAFRPDEQTCRLRAYLRQRANLVRSASRHVQHVQKALEQMNLKLTEVLSDITGVTGRAILRAILRGTRAPEKLARYRDKQCQASEAEI